MPSSELVAALDRLARAQVSMLVYRHLAPGYEAMSGEGARVTGGRWNPPDSFPVLYTATSIECVAEEFKRMARKERRDVEDFLPRRLVSYRTSLERVLDLTQADNLAALGLTSSIVTAEDVIPSQSIGDAAFYVGFEGVLAPSATRMGAVLAVFPTKLGSQSTIEVVADESLLAKVDVRR